MPLTTIHRYTLNRTPKECGEVWTWQTMDTNTAIRKCRQLSSFYQNFVKFRRLEVAIHSCKKQLKKYGLKPFAFLFTPGNAGVQALCFSYGTRSRVYVEFCRCDASSTHWMLPEAYELETFENVFQPLASNDIFLIKE